MKLPFTKRAAGLCCVLLLALFLVRPGVGPLRGEISTSIGQALGKRVEIGNVHLRLFPRIGFELDDVLIHDDPRFGAEPLLRSPDVTAWLRVTSLLRGRLEISSLSLKDASVNLTRTAEGQWNLQDLVERTRNSTAAPTASKQSRPEFPYIEATDARINFKFGWEKTHFALTDSDIALWQDSENTWGIRLRARPIRTDANLTDTGILEVSGTWQRASSLAAIPVRLGFQWKHAQAGQISKLAYGADQGWRGDAQISANISGTPEKLTVALDGAIDDFRRFDVLGGGDLPLALHCAAEYNSTRRMLSDIDCTAPAGSHSLELKGSASALWPPEYSITVSAANFPAHNILNLVRHMDGSIPPALDTTGDVSGAFVLHRGPASAQPQVTGDGEVSNLRLTSNGDEGLIRIARLPFAITRDAKSGNRSMPIDNLAIGPATVPMGRNSPLELRALLSRNGYDLSVTGDAGIRPLLRAARALGVAVPAITADGGTTVNLALSGTWTGPQPRATGTAQLRNVTAQVSGLNSPLRTASAKLSLSQGLVRVQNLKGSAAAAEWRGSMEIPRPCRIPHDCNFHFNLAADKIDVSDVNALLNPGARKQSWYKFFAGTPPTPFLLQARGGGRISIGTLAVGKRTYDKFNADLELDNGKVQLKNVRVDLFGGTGSGTFKADFRAKPPAYSGTGTLDSISLSQVAELMQNSWVSGTGDASYDFKASGSNLQDVLDSADVQATFEVEDGDFPHVVLTRESGPLQMDVFRGVLALKKRKISLDDAKLTTQNGVFKVSGTASFAGDLNFKLSAENAPSYNVTGTLLKVSVSAIPQSPTQASLKP